MARRRARVLNSMVPVHQRVGRELAAAAEGLPTAAREPQPAQPVGHPRGG